MGTILAQAPISIVYVASLPPYQKLEVFFATIRRRVIPGSPGSGGGNSYSGRHSVFLEIQDQASRHRAVTQVQHCFLVLTFEMVVEAIRGHHSHDARSDRGPGIFAQPLGPGAHVQ